jgi:uncharacterized protein involved in exopolysaccharide biosynthesis
MVRYLETFFRHRVLFAIPVGLIVLVSTLVVLTQPSSYLASTRLWVDKPAIDDGSGVGSNPFVTPAAEQMQSLQELLNTRYFTIKVAHRGPLASRLASTPQELTGYHWVAAKLRGRSTGGALPSAADVNDMAYDILTSNVSVYAAGPQIIQINFTYSDPKVAAGTAQAIIDQFVDESLSSARSRAQVQEDFYGGQIKQASQVLAAADQAVNQYLAAHPEQRSPSAVPDARLTQLQQTDLLARQAVSDMQSKIDAARLQEAGLSAAGASGMRLLDPAIVPAEAGTSRKLLVEAGGAGLGVGLVVLVLGLLALTLTDTTLRRPDEVEPALGLRLVGSIPHLSSRPQTG